MLTVWTDDPESVTVIFTGLLGGFSRLATVKVEPEVPSDTVAG